MSRPPLTDRELAVVTLVASGRTNAQVGHALEISEQTVKNYMTSIFGKLGASDRAHAVALLYENWPGWRKGKPAVRPPVDVRRELRQLIARLDSDGART